MSDRQMRGADRPPILRIALGRQRVGKTVLLNTAVQYFRGLGDLIKVLCWDGLCLFAKRFEKGRFIWP